MKVTVYWSQELVAFFNFSTALCQDELRAHLTSVTKNFPLLWYYYTRVSTQPCKYAPNRRRKKNTQR